MDLFVTYYRKNTFLFARYPDYIELAVGFPAAYSNPTIASDIKIYGARPRGPHEEVTDR
jgi:hypothetical protein